MKHPVLRDSHRWKGHGMLPEQRCMNIGTYRKCFDICDKVKERRKGKKIDVHDYPAAVVSCADSWAGYEHAKIETSGKVNKNSYAQTPQLESALKSLGNIGQKRDACDNYIGACAEPHAARTVIKDWPGLGVRDLRFSYAYRPRTKTVIRYCLNCIDVFDVNNP